MKSKRKTHKSFQTNHLRAINVLIEDRYVRTALIFARNVHFAFESVHSVNRLTADREGWVHHEYFVAGLVEDLQPSVVFDSLVWFSLPAGEWVAILVDVSASHEK